MPAPARFLLCAATALGLAALVTPLAAEAREIRGAFAYKERIALPRDASIAIEVRQGDRVVAEFRADTAGWQVPLPFALDVPGAGGQVLSAAVLVDGRPRWVTAPMPLPEETEASVDLGTVTLMPFATAGFASRMDCGGQIVQIGFSGQDGAVLTIGTDSYDLLSTPAASGAKFTDGASPETLFWSKGDKAQVTVKGVDLPECTLLREEGLALPFVARGNEPGWVLNATEAGVSLSREDGVNDQGPLPTGEDSEVGTRYAVSENFAFVVDKSICRDTMTGMPYPATVFVEQEDGMVNGCGGNPADLLKGDWRVSRIAEADVPADVEVSMTFDGDRVAGKSGCNRYTGGITLTGEALRFGPAAGTRMACIGAGMEVEAAFLATLDQIDRFDIGAEGELLLIGGDVTLITARR